MSIYNKDEVKGKFEQAKGVVKDKVGEVTGNERLEAEGEAERAGGEAREGWAKLSAAFRMRLIRSATLSAMLGRN